ncbi:nucleotide sugar dehydrogenase [Psychrobacter sp. FDAARGOS_221]|uniref:nucleotide sugar dehydrogenase n=1 Tax=Psychrobacter sp. FDAARGOS_221 TaxID=1975705 RepID=UPI000BB59E80|nr:nucleotide sugar dehydrogenase [Psychrobacter sp. FDAARGOS_221]PNK60482.1 nucleotide sugar dehydrogenase [Psychrobacter sp. FDAARGOS_221]
MTDRTNLTQTSLKNIVVIGAGYVGLSNAILLAQTHLNTQVLLFDIDQHKISLIQHKQSPLQDPDICDYLSNQSLNLKATTQILIDDQGIYTSAVCDLVIITTPTNYDVASGKFDTSSVETSIAAVREQNANVPIVIKSTIPIGFTDCMRQQFDQHILFMPEFLREGQALHDNLHPSRIIVGASADQQNLANALINLYQHASLSDHVESLVMPPTEAEAVKLFANSYLATRISFFNELDSFAEKHQLNSQSIITGVGLDPRIGLHYNNPSFGYGGYCLPKDTQQLKANYAGIPANLIHAVVDANNTRKRFIARQIIDKNCHQVGIYRLSMKKDADNFRDSAILDIIDIIKQHGVSITIYEPAIETDSFNDCQVIHDLAQFKQQNSLIIANRWHHELDDIKDRVYSRDVFGYS